MQNVSNKMKIQIALTNKQKMLQNLYFKQYIRQPNFTFAAPENLEIFVRSVQDVLVEPPRSGKPPPPPDLGV